MQFTGQFSVLIGQKMQLTAWHHSNNIRSATYMDTNFISVALLSNPYAELWTQLAILYIHRIMDMS